MKKLFVLDACALIAFLNDEIFFESARLKAIYKISLADSIALALSVTRKASFVTADHHDFDKIEKKEKLSFEWIR